MSPRNFATDGEGVPLLLRQSAALAADTRTLSLGAEGFVRSDPCAQDAVLNRHRGPGDVWSIAGLRGLRPPSASHLKPTYSPNTARLCHGAGATGTDRGPALANSRDLRSRSEGEIHDIIRSGTSGGMPAFSAARGAVESAGPLGAFAKCVGVRYQARRRC